MPEGPALGRVEAKRRALTTPRTARASKTRWCQARNPTCRMRRSSGKDGHASGPNLRTDDALLCPGELGHDHVHAGGAFVWHVLSTHDRDRGHDQRWRERPRRGPLGPPAGAGQRGRSRHRWFCDCDTGSGSDGGTKRRLTDAFASSRSTTNAWTQFAVMEPPGVRGHRERAQEPGGQPDAIFASPPSWSTLPGRRPS